VKICFTCAAGTYSSFMGTSADEICLLTRSRKFARPNGPETTRQSQQSPLSRRSVIRVCVFRVRRLHSLPSGNIFEHRRCVLCLLARSLASAFCESVHSPLIA
jgi:hypothetical protein